MPFVDVTRLAGEDFARIGLCGIEGSGKTLTALKIARGLAGPDGRIAVIDTENRSSRKFRAYERFDVAILDGNFAPAKYVELLGDAEKAGYSVVIVDSLSHAWIGPGGVLDIHDKEAARIGDNYGAWRKASPEHNRLVDKLIHCKCHIICTLRMKSETAVEQVNGRIRIRKLGMQPIQREGMLYEFDIVVDIDQDHICTVSKSRCPALDGMTFGNKDLNVGLQEAEMFGRQVRDWLETGSGRPKAAIVAESIREEAAKAGLDVDQMLAAAGDDLAALDAVAAFVRENRG